MVNMMSYKKLLILLTCLVGGLSVNLQSNQEIQQNCIQNNEDLIKKVDYITNKKVSQYIYADRFLNDLNSLDLHKILGKFKANSKETTTFQLPYFEIPLKNVDIYVDGSNNQLAQRFYNDQIALMYVHPLNLEQENFPHLDEMKNVSKHSVEVVPTCTSRTLVTLEPKVDSYFIKTHLPFQLDGTVTKNFYNTRIKHEIQVSKELGQTKLPFTFAFLREPIGIAWKNDDNDENNGWGYLVREMEASPYLGKQTYMVPMYSLFAQDSLDPKEMPLLYKLIERSKEDPKKYVLEKIMYPVFDCFVEGIKKMGFIFLSHGQNVLLELDEKYQPTGRIIHRDFGVEVDVKIRQKLNLPLTNIASVYLFNLPNQDEAPGQRYSLSYDNALGRHLFEKLTNFLNKYYGIQQEEVRTEFLKYFEKKFPDFADYFITNNVYRSTGGIKVVSDKPMWRPLIK